MATERRLFHAIPLATEARRSVGSSRSVRRVPEGVESAGSGGGAERRDLSGRRRRFERLKDHDREAKGPSPSSRKTDGTGAFARPGAGVNRQGDDAWFRREWVSAHERPFTIVER
jgi:hypothetical protein